MNGVPMLSREVMGVLALAILWVNTLLIAGAALKRAGELRRKLRALRGLAAGEEGAGLLEARIEEGDADFAIARFEVEQLGRAGAEDGGRRTIHFGDRTFASAVLGGVVSAGETRIRLTEGDGDVWPDRADVLAAAACSGPEQFDEVFETARKARGHSRTVRVDLRAGRTVWIGGEIVRTDSDLTLRASPAIGLLVSAIDPRAWLRRSSLLAVGFALAESIVAGAITALVLVPPVLDGWPSKLGGALGLAFFLLVQPLGTAVRDAIRTPGSAFVRGRWIDGEARAQGEGKSLQQRVPVE